MTPPVSTYRIQFNRDFTFSHLQQLVPYLHALGVSTIYASPVTTACAGSMHGYDVTDPGKINSEIGSREELESLIDTLKRYGMGWLQDIVPNHMAFSPANPWLMDVLERGPQSPYYLFFDIDWDHPDPELNGRVGIPFLGGPREEAIGRGEIALDIDGSGWHIRYGEYIFPLSLSSYPVLLSALSADTPLRRLTAGFAQLAGYPSSDLQQARHLLMESAGQDIAGSLDTRLEIATLHADKELLRNLLHIQYYTLYYWRDSEKLMNYRRFFTVNTLICLSMEKATVFNAWHRLLHELYAAGRIQGVRIDHIDGLYDPGEYLCRLRELLGGDCYIIAEKILNDQESLPPDWPLEGTSGYEFLSDTNGLLTDRTGARSIYRFYQRFTGITASYKDIVFKNKHRFLCEQMGGELDNLLRYLLSLRVLPSGASVPQPPTPAQHTEPVPQFSPARQALKDTLAVLMASFPVYRIYPRQLPLDRQSQRVVDEAFSRAARRSMTAQPALAVLRTLFEAGGDELAKIQFLRRLMQFTGPLAAKGVEDTTFYVYDPLISHNEVGDSPDVPPTAPLDAPSTVPLDTPPTAPRDSTTVAPVPVSSTPPAHRDSRTVSSGSTSSTPTAPRNSTTVVPISTLPPPSPRSEPFAITAFHQKMISCRKNNSLSLNATSTHDTKRGEDARLRINALAAHAGEWQRQVETWQRVNSSFFVRLDGPANSLLNPRIAPSPNDAWFIYQSLVGGFPEDLQVSGEFLDRTEQFIVKALREARKETNYADPDQAYEQGCISFIRNILAPHTEFLRSFVPFLQKILPTAEDYSLAELVIKCTAPGIPDIYQGCELWNLSYVDPDNRRPVDYALRTQLLQDLMETEELGPEAVMDFLQQHRDKGVMKLFALRKLLWLRRSAPDLFLSGDYLPLRVHKGAAVVAAPSDPSGEAGPSQEASVLAYARQHGNDWLLVVWAPTVAGDTTLDICQPTKSNDTTLDALQPERAADTTSVILPPGAPHTWTDIFTGHSVTITGALPLADRFAGFPIVVLRS